jgi:hypothetical protein
MRPILLLAFCAALMGADEAPFNALTKAEADAGWKLLFDGTSLDAFRGFKKDVVPDGWKAVDGTLARLGGGGDLVTKDEYTDFDFQYDWKISPGGNSGVMFHVIEDFHAPYESGPEMQVLDNAKHPDGRNPKTSAGADYALIAVSKDTVRPAGEWNHARLVVAGDHVEHWLNGEKVVEYELRSPAWQGLVQASKFKAMKGYGMSPKGHLCLQDHGDQVWYRNLKILVPAGK